MFFLIYKGGTGAFPRNYCPVALISHFKKILDFFAENDHQLIAEKKNELKPTCFRSGRSCLSQLQEDREHHEILDEVKKSNSGDVIYLDVAPVFDKVDHGILLNKL